MTISEGALLLDGALLVPLESSESGPRLPASAMDEQLVEPLYRALRDGDAGRHALAVLSQDPRLFEPAPPVIEVHADNPFSVLRSVLYTAGQAGFGSFLLPVRNPYLDAVTAVETGLPTLALPQPPEADPGQPTPQLTLSVMVDGDGLLVAGADAVLYPDGAPENPEDSGIPCRGDGGCAALADYDWAEYARQLTLVKQAWPDHLFIIVVPSSQVPFEVIVRTIDVARWAPHLPLDASQEAWERWRQERSLLFPFDCLAGGAK